MNPEGSFSGTGAPATLYRNAIMAGNVSSRTDRFRTGGRREKSPANSLELSLAPSRNYQWASTHGQARARFQFGTNL